MRWHEREGTRESERSGAPLLGRSGKEGFAEADPSRSGLQLIRYRADIDEVVVESGAPADIGDCFGGRAVHIAAAG